MNASRAAVMVVGVNLIAVWVAAAAGGRMAQPAPQAGGSRLTPDQAVVQAQSALLEATDRLRRHSGPPPEASVVERDPFHFGAPARLDRRADRVPDQASAPAAAALPVEPPFPEIVLEGMAETREADAVVRTAILSAGGELILATLGTTVGGRYKVVGLSAESVELEDTRDLRRVTIRMR